MMSKHFKSKTALFILLAMICQLLSGCGTVQSKPTQTPNVIYETFISEDYIEETVISEEFINENYVTENLIYEDGIYEYFVNEDIISEAYIIEVTVGEDTYEDILAQLPEEIEDYDIDWDKVIKKFAVGTAIIIAVGIVNYATKGTTFFVFGSPATVARDALTGGAIGATLRALNGYLKNGKLPSNAIKKYAIEGFSEGYMWGAIASVTKIAGEDFRRLKVFKLATGNTASINLDGRVFNDAGKLIGQAYYDKSGIWFLADEITHSVQVFDKAGKAITDPQIVSAITTLPKNAMLRLGTAPEAAICWTDDAGQIIRTGNELGSNLVYKINGYEYYTDGQGRIVKVIFDDLKLKPGGRARLDIFDRRRDIGKGYELVTDQRGHLIADMFDGDNTLANIVPMDGNVNQGVVKEIETGWQFALRSGRHVSGSIELTYSGESFRPDSFEYVYDMGDGLVSTIIQNSPL